MKSLFFDENSRRSRARLKLILEVFQLICECCRKWQQLDFKLREGIFFENGNLVISRKFDPNKGLKANFWDVSSGVIWERDGKNQWQLVQSILSS